MRNVLTAPIGKLSLWRWLLLLPTVLLTIWGLLPLFFVPYHPTWFMVMVVGIGVVCVFLLLRPGTLSGFYRTLWKRAWGKGLLIVFHVLLLCGIVAANVFTVWMFDAADRQPEPNTPLIICGARVTEEGPAPVLTARLEAAVAYLNRNPEALCVVTGGQGRDEPRAEGDVMGEYLREKGIDPARILVENQSVNTEENMQFGLILLRTHGYEGDALAVCTDGVHQYRAQRNAEQMGFSTSAVSAPIPWFQLLNHWVREVMAIGKTVVFA